MRYFRSRLLQGLDLPGNVHRLNAETGEVSYSDHYMQHWMRATTECAYLTKEDLLRAVVSRELVEV